MRRKPYKPYTREFKLEAIRLAEVGDKTSSQVARDLGLRPNQIWKWKQQLATLPATGPGQRSAQQLEEEVRRLKRELLHVSRQRDILKKTLGILSEPSGSALNG